MIMPILQPNQPRSPDGGDEFAPATTIEISSSAQQAVEQGLIEMRRIITAGIAAAAGACLVLAMTTAASAQELSENSVQTLMDYAWSLTPDRFTKPDGVVIEVDRNNRKATEVPLDAARDVIKAGRLSAHAQTCDLKEEHAANYRGFMLREAQKQKWSEQQMLYMNQLHLVTVMLLTGKLQVIEREDGKEPKVIEEGAKTDAKSCTEEQKAKVREAITAFVKTVPLTNPGTSKAAAGGPAPPPPAATPASAPAKK